MAGSIEFTPPYQDGWQDNEEGATPITADILNNNYDAFLLLLNTWIGNIEEELVAVPDFQISSPSSGQVLKYDGSKWVNAAESGGGSNVSWNQIVQTGTQIASITINGTSYAVYAPSGGSSVSINRKTTTGTNIADITIDGVTTQLFAPNGGSGGASSLNELSDVTLANLANGQVLQYNSNTSKWENKSISVGDSVEFTQILSSGVKIGTITIDGTDYDIYAPQGGGGGFEPNGDSYRIVSSKDGSDTVLSLEYYEDGSQSAVEMKMCEAGSSFTQDFHNLHLVSNGTTVSVSSKIDSIRFNDDIFNENDEIFSITIGSATATYSDIEEGTYTPGGGSSVEWTQTQQSGTKIAEISIDGVSQNVYIPNLPTKTSDLTNDSNFVADASYVHTDNNYTTTEKNKLGDLVQVVANPQSGTSAGDLTSIGIGGTKYNIPSGGGGGTTVIANPSGEATVELEKLQVGSTIYSIPEGGSASWKDITGTLTAGQTEITLADPVINSTSTFEPFTDKFGVNPTNMELVAGAETVLQPLVTQESELLGTVTVSSVFAEDYVPWKAFTSAGSWVGTGNIDQWLAYEFPTNVIVSKVQWFCDDTSRRGTVTNIQYSNDGTTWNNCTLSKNERGDVEISSVNSAKYWRLFFAAPFGSWQEPMIGGLEFIAVVNGVKLTFPVQSENLNVKVRVS